MPSTRSSFGPELFTLSENIAILEREHKELLFLVAKGPPRQRSLRLRQLEAIAQRLDAARDEATQGRL